MGNINICINDVSVAELHTMCRQLLNGDMDGVEVKKTPSHPPVPEGAQGKPVTEQPVKSETTPVTDTASTTSAETKKQEPANQLDELAHGIPWDERIHTVKHTKNGDGSWKNKKIPKDYKERPAAWKAFIEEVTAELKAGVAENDESEDPGEGMDDPNEVFKTEGATSDATDDNVPKNFDEVLVFLATVTDHARVLSVCQELEIVNVFELDKKPELIPDFYEKVTSGE